MYNRQEPLQTSITDAATACKQYRDYIANNYKGGVADGYTSYLLNSEDLDALLKGGTLGGIRIYIGHEDRDNGPLVRLFMVGCKKEEDGSYHDQIEPKPTADPATVNMATRSGEGPAIEMRVTSGRPCPSECGGTSRLNS